MSHVITVAQQKGGSGKTTVAANLAICAALSGKSVAIIDSDPQGSLGRWFMARRERQGLVMPSFSTASAWGIAYECDKLKADHDLVIVDTPPKADADLRPAFRASDLVIVPVAASQVDVWATEGVMDLAEREKKDVFTVLNRARAGTRLAGEMTEALSEMDSESAKTILAQRVIYAETLGQGLSVCEVQKSGPAAAEVSALTEEVLAKLDRL